MSSNHFDNQSAASYDTDVAAAFDPALLRSTVDRLAELAGDGQALEFAIGTGRVALPLAERGVPVVGIELSEGMVAELRKKPGGDAEQMPVVVGDMSTATAPSGKFNLVYLIFNTIMNVTSQDEQVACFQNAARHLEPGGFFVVETMVPQLRRLPIGQHHVVFEATSTHIGIDEYNTANQNLVSHHVFNRDGRTERQAIPFRYVWPSELDLMARIAGMELQERWADWDKSPFTSESEAHVSVWKRPNVSS